MNIDTVTSLIYAGIELTIRTSMPSIGVGMAVGLAIAIIQAVTQVQEQTLAFVPKMIIVLLVIGLTFPWMSRVIMEYAIGLWGNIPMYSK